MTDESDGKSGLAFSQALGFASVHEEDHLVLPLAAGVDRVASLAGGGVGLRDGDLAQALPDRRAVHTAAERMHEAQRRDPR